VGYKYIKDKKLRTHGLIMTTAVISHTITILFVMIPSFIINFEILIKNIFSPGVIITWIHTVVGILTEMLGIYIVLKQRLLHRTACAKRKWIMKPLFILWTLASIMGILFYSYYYL